MDLALKISEIYLWLFRSGMLLIVLSLSAVPLWVGCGIIFGQIRFRKWLKIPAIITQCKKIPVDESEEHEGIYKLDLQCKYLINGVERTSQVGISTGDDEQNIDKEILNYSPGKEIVVFVNPRDPRQSSLLSEQNSRYIVFGSILIFLGLSLLGMIIKNVFF